MAWYDEKSGEESINHNHSKGAEMKWRRIQLMSLWGHCKIGPDTRPRLAIHITSSAPRPSKRINRAKQDHEER